MTNKTNAKTSGNLSPIDSPREVLKMREKKIINTVKAIRKGDSIAMDFLRFEDLKINLISNLKIMKASSPANRGEIIQDKTTCPNFPQLTISLPPATNPNPIKAPIIEWVVEIGKDFQVAKVIQNPAAKRADTKPIMASLGSWIKEGSTIPFRTVSVT